MKIFFYCQHVLGVGHFFRTLEICRKLDGHEVVLVTGGAPVAIPLPAHVREERLPSLMMDEHFRALIPGAGQQEVAEVRQRRQRQLWKLFKAERPELFIVELYPFGRKKFRFELDPILSAIKDGRLPPCKVVCSLRDILVEKDDPAKYEARVIDVMNRYFDALLVHADKKWLRLDQTFGRMADLDADVVYTGFVASSPSPDARRRVRDLLQVTARERLVIASAGGGKVGGRLLRAVIAAMDHLPDDNLRLMVFSGPFMEVDDFNRLKEASDRRIVVRRFTDQFLDYLAAADLSLSMAGYNTCMNILASGVPALVWPFDQNREQRMRAQLLAGQGALQVLENSDLEPHRLADVMRAKLNQPTSTDLAIDLDGAARTAAWLARAFEGRWRSRGRGSSRKA